MTNGASKELALRGATEVESKRRKVKPLVGSTKPRLYTPLLKGQTLSDEIAELAEKIGMPLLPWQKWVFDDMLQVDKDGKFRRGFCGLLVARQPRMVKHTLRACASSGA